MKSCEEQVLEELKKPQDRKMRYNFTLSQSTKQALSAWCKKHNHKESTTIEAMIKKVLPIKFFKK